MEQTIFKVRDKVFDIRHGWGEVVEHFRGDYLIKFQSVTNAMLYNEVAIKMVSFTEYTLDGFSQKRPELLPNKGDVVWVRDREYDNWMITYFMKLGGGELRYGTNPRKSDDSVHCYYYKYLTTIDPYKDGKQG